MIKLILLALLCVTGSPPKADFLVAASSQQPSYHSDGGGGRAGSTDLRGQRPHSLPVGRGFQPDVPTSPRLSGVHSDADHPHDVDYAAFDTIETNNSAQIGMIANSRIYLGNDLQPTTWIWSDWCHNNIVDYPFWGGGCCSSQYPLINVQDPTSSTDLGDISRNYFDSADPSITTIAGCTITSNLGTPSFWGTSIEYIAMGFCYSAPIGSNFLSWQARSAGTIECEDALPPIAKSRISKTQSVLTDTSCRGKYADADSYVTSGNDIKAYPLLQRYMETCYDSGSAWRGFVDLDYAVQGLSNDLGRFANYREWIKSVVWLNPSDPYWYCTAVQSIMFTYQWDSTARGHDDNAALAVARYIESSHHCPQDSGYYAQEDSGTRAVQHQHWLDTCQMFGHDTLLFPEDTTLPSLHSLGLDILYGPPSSVTSGVWQPGMGELHASANPFRKETTISYESGEYAYTSFQVLDILGHVVQGDFKGSVLNPGEHSFTIDGTQLPAGTYYARVSTLAGGTRMIKLVKE